MSALSRAEFAAQIGTDFKVHLQGGPECDLHLESAEEERKGKPGPTEQFSLLFRGPLEPFLPQASYSMQHPVLGDQDIFITALSKDPQGYVYQAAFNRLRNL